MHVGEQVEAAQDPESVSYGNIQNREALHKPDPGHPPPSTLNMENDSTFVAPEGVYSLTDEHKLSPIQIIAVSGGLAVYPSKFSTVSLKFANAKPSGNSAGFTGLLGGGNKQEGKKDKAEKHKDREDGVSMSSSDTPDGSEPSAPSGQDNVPAEQHTLFSNPTQAGKKKPAPRPRHNLRTTSSSFITRIQTAEGITKTLQSKQGDVTFVFFNVAKTLVWVEAGSKAKVMRFIVP